MALINPQAPARNVDRISPKGFAEAFDIYELRSEQDGRNIADFEICRDWEIVYLALRNGPPAVAERELAAFLTKYPDDGVARYHMQRLGQEPRGPRLRQVP